MESCAKQFRDKQTQNRIKEQTLEVCGKLPSSQTEKTPDSERNKEESRVPELRHQMRKGLSLSGKTLQLLIHPQSPTIHSVLWRRRVATRNRGN